MDKKVFYTLVAIAICVLLLLFSWRFFLGVVVALAVVYFFGENKVKSFLTDLFSQTKTTVEQVYDGFKTEEKKVVVESVSVTSTSQHGWYQLVIEADNKKWFIKPSSNSLIPEVLTAGAEITIKTERNLTSNGLKTQTVIIAEGEIFEVVD